MAAPAGLVNSLNRIREISSDIYHQHVPIVTSSTSIDEFAAPILEFPQVQNEFIAQLMNRIVFTSFNTKMYRSPLKQLEGNQIPLGYAGQDIYVNPAKGRMFNVDDFAGLLAKYESQVKVQYLAINRDVQYCATASRAKLQKAFVSWDALNSFVDEITNSLYNGAYIDEYRFTKELISSAYKTGSVVTEAVSNIFNEAGAKAFIQDIRTAYLNFQAPSTQYNGWSRVGDGDKITTWTNPEDVVFIVRNDVLAYTDVNVLADAFNMDKASFMGKVIAVDNFDVYSDEGVKVYDGSNIYGMLADRAWFKIMSQDMQMDEFYNPNNRTWQLYLNSVKMYNYSLFANAIVFASEVPEIEATAVEFKSAAISAVAGSTVVAGVKTTPINANTEVTYAVTTGTADDLVLSPSDDTKTVEIEVGDGADGDYVITATVDGKTGTMTLSV